MEKKEKILEFFQKVRQNLNAHVSIKYKDIKKQIILITAEPRSTRNY